MEIWINSATREKDYSWCSAIQGGSCCPPSEISSGYDLWKFEDGAPWFGLVSCNGVSTLYFGNLMTDREDVRTRPILVHAVIRATRDDERRELFSAAAELLENEKEHLTKWTAYFLGIFDGNATMSRPTVPVQKQSSLPLSIGRFAYAREDSVARVRIAQALRESCIESPIVVGTTGRSGKGIFERVCDSGKEWQVAFFSGMCTDKAELVPKVVCPDFPQSPFPFNRTGAKIAAVAAVAMIVWAILPGDSEKGLKPSQKIAEESQKTQSCTNLPPKAVKSCETNSADCLGDSVMTGKNK